MEQQCLGAMRRILAHTSCGKTAFSPDFMRFRTQKDSKTALTMPVWAQAAAGRGEKAGFGGGAAGLSHWSGCHNARGGRSTVSCPICEIRKEKRFCPAVHGRICAQCCGEQREVTLDCPSDCPYLRQAREHEKPRAAGDLQRFWAGVSAWKGCSGAN